MEAKDIIIRLIDNHQITGEEASVLLGAITSKRIEFVPTIYPNPQPFNYPITCYGESCI